MDFNMNIIDIVISEEGPAVNHDLNANLGRKGARDNSNPDDNRRGRLASYPNMKWVQACTLHPHFLQISIHGITKSGLPDIIETVHTNKSTLLGVKVCFRTLWN